MLEKLFYRYEKGEFQAAQAELNKLSPQESLISFYRRHDAAVVKAIDSAVIKPACRAGCSYCCYYKVEARAVEVLAILHYVLSKFKPDIIRQITEQAIKNVDEAKNLSHIEHLGTNQRCPFLINDQCSIYPVRPSKCRNFHAADIQGCKDSYEQPTNLSILSSYIPEVFAAANGITEGFECAANNAGLDPRVYDLNSAFVEALKNPSASKRLRAGKKAFLVAKVVQAQQA